ncbi:MAG: hypothetical protein H6672_02045 [Anaerolineaceae bacterium]|nr:hypothetical protein [Anaerolineaceae bacterium]
MLKYIRQFLRRPAGLIGTSMLAVVVIAAVFAPWIALTIRMIACRYRLRTSSRRQTATIC